MRNNNEINYGDPSKEYIVFLNVVSSKQVGGQEIADKVQVALISTDTSLDFMQRIKKQGVKIGLYDALDVGGVWLQSTLSNKSKAKRLFRRTAFFV